ncbi:hypothetical protein OTU49_003791 [Cherax quadricarinatus]|uniref:Mucin-5AC-like n=2 Tax=Cherax quadricarinatus TaxID=27406 RepID=A0AAW0X3E3_CHEQU
MQVRAHRDDWEAERCEKRATQTALAEAQARTALLLHELQLLQAKLTESESKRGLCWRCVLPRGGDHGGGGGGGCGGRGTTTTTTPAPPPPPPPPPSPSSITTTSTTSTTQSTTTQASPVTTPLPASSPSPAPPTPPTHDLPQAPLKGWIPVSMLHQIAFSGATPEHQTPVVQDHKRSQQPSRAPIQHHRHQQHHQQGKGQGQTGSSVLTPRPTTLNTNSSVKRGEVDLQLGLEYAIPRFTGSGSESKVLSPRTCAPETKNLVIGTTDDKKKYEAMGARPKILGNLQSVAGKGLGLLEDEKTAKHRARSILASAIPVSPVSSGPSMPCGSSIMKSPSVPNMPKGYMPITSTVLTPINFRSPFVAHKRPSTMKQVAQAAQIALQISSSSSSSSTSSTHGRNGSSAASIGGALTTTSPTSGCHTTPTTKHILASDTINTVGTKDNKQINNMVITSQDDRVKSPTTTNQENNVKNGNSEKNEPDINTPSTAGSRKGDISSSTAIKRGQSSEGTLAVSSISCSSPTTTLPCTNTSGNTFITSSNVTAVTTTVSCSSLASLTTTTTTSSLPSLIASSVNAETFSSGMAGYNSVSSVHCQPSCGNTTTFQSSSQSSKVSLKSTTSTTSSPTVSTDTVSSPSADITVVSQNTTSNANSANISSISQNFPRTDLPSETSYINTTSSQSSSTSSNTTAFASITVTTTATGTNIPPAASTYSSATSSRSSSPGISLTTFGLNSEGRGIPGTIFFALGSDQRGVRSPQPCTSPRPSNSSLGVKSPTPESVTAPKTQRDTLPPSGVKSPPIIVNSCLGPTTVKEEHWWSVESPGRPQGQGKVVNSTWVRLMGGQANSRQGSGLPWRTARAVSGQQLNQARRASHDDYTNGPVSPNTSSSTATFNYTPAVNSPPSSTLSSATNSAASSPPPTLHHRSSDDLKSMASKNIASAIISYELGTKCEGTGSGTGSSGAQSSSSDGVATLTRKHLVCPSCQMLFPPDKHINFLDHFEVCHGPEYADL